MGRVGPQKPQAPCGEETLWPPLPLRDKRLPSVPFGSSALRPDVTQLCALPAPPPRHTAPFPRAGALPAPSTSGGGRNARLMVDGRVRGRVRKWPRVPGVGLGSEPTASSGSAAGGGSPPGCPWVWLASVSVSPSKGSLSPPCHHG